MNIETANRLYEQRKKMKLSQEELAEKIGVSRQAVSKWERAEASPDTDNLIALSRIYGISLDELIMGKKEDIAVPIEIAEKSEANEDQTVSESEIKEENKEEAIKLITDTEKTTEDNFDKYDEYEEKYGNYNCDYGFNYETENKTKTKNSKLHKTLMSFPYPILVTVLFLLFGCYNICGGWVYGWLIFFSVPLYYTLINAIHKKNPSVFCFPVFVTWIYLFLGFKYVLWHPMWILFLTIPLYYGICSAFKK